MRPSRKKLAFTAIGIMLAGYLSTMITVIRYPNLKFYCVAVFAIGCLMTFFIITFGWRRIDKEFAARREITEEQWQRDYLFREKMITDPPPLAVDRPTILLSLDELLESDEIPIEQYRD
jgi:hypothetical protein